tara:strand:- start:438 stop:665 length:228 start_codon:yes stop_codon:yes gene_type:complete
MKILPPKSVMKQEAIQRISMYADKYNKGEEIDIADFFATMTLYAFGANESEVLHLIRVNMLEAITDFKPRRTLDA